MNEEAWLNQRVCVFDNIRKNGKAYLYCTLKPLLYSVEATEVATTVIHIGKKDYPNRRKTPSFSYGDIRRVSFAGSMPVKDTIQRR